jgi:DNA invertase Pin-like site-specific DNA recombinase
MSPTPTKPCDIYLRVSRVGGRSGDSFISPEVQRASCEGIAQARGIEVGRVFTDLDQSGGKMDRPALNEALARINAGVSGGIIVARLDRFARTLTGALDTLEEIDAAGGVVIAADGDFDTSTSTGRLMRDFVLRLAQYYREQVAERWEEAHTSMIERGVHSGAAPVGYKKGPDKILVPNGNAEQIRKAFRMRVTGANWGEVARYLTEKGVPTKSGKTTWTHGAARKLLDNRAYLGEARHGDKVKTFAHEPLVNETTFHLANHKSARLSGERGDGRLLGGGLCRCGTCGGGLTYGKARPKRKDGTHRTYEFLRCATPGKGHAAISVSVIEPYLTAVAEGIASSAPRGENIADAELRCYAADRMLAAVDAEQADMDAITYGRARAQAVREKDAADAALSAALDDVGGQVPEWTDVRAGRAFLKQALGRATIKPGRGTVEERVTVGA